MSRTTPAHLTNQDDSGSELIVPVLDPESVRGTLDVESDGIRRVRRCHDRCLRRSCSGAVAALDGVGRTRSAFHHP